MDLAFSRMRDRLELIQAMKMETQIWKFAGLYPLATAMMVIIGGLMIRFFLLLIYHRRRMHGLVSFFIFRNSCLGRYPFVSGAERKKERGWGEKAKD